MSTSQNLECSENMTPEGRVDHLSIRISNMLHDLPLTSSEPCIFKVQNPLRKINEAAFDPQVVAIGPYHRGKKDLQFMEEHKLRYLQLLLKRRNENNVERYIVALRELNERARKCYAESVSLSSDEFVEMMLLDGCFIIELFRKTVLIKLRDEHDPIFKFPCKYLFRIQRDQMLFENQLPFFVLSKLFDMTEDHQMSFTLDALVILSFQVKTGKNFPNWNRNSKHEVKHLLDLLHNNLLPSFVETEAVENVTGEKWSFMRCAKVKHMFDWIHNNFLPSSAETKAAEITRKKWPFMRCAKELQEVSVKFKKLEDDNGFNIKFNNGVMEIPTLTIVDSTESIFRNLVAYEQYCVDIDCHYVSDFVVFMNHLINCPKDVELLSRHGIIDNRLGDDEEVSTLFNTLGKNVAIIKLRYSAICQNINIHCRKRWNIRKANLRHNYFNSPWAFISFLAATLLLLFTVAQTVFSIID